MLLLKRHLVELVRAGKKRQTVRLWSRALLRVGQVSYTPGLGKMLITAVDRLGGLGELTEADAVADGFPNLKALHAEIRRIYGATIPAGRSVYRIKFEWPVGKAAETANKLENTKHETRNTKRVEEKTRHASRIAKPAETRGAPKAVRATARPVPGRGVKVRMSRAEREALRAFVVERAPRP